MKLRIDTLSKVVLAVGCFLFPLMSLAQTQLPFADYNDQGFFNNFSGDSGVFANGDGASVTVAFDTHVFRGANGASLRVDYSVPNGFCGVWNSLMGKDSFPQYTVNFTNIYDGLRNSAGNPTRVQGVRVTKFNFWARGDGKGDHSHQVKVEFKTANGAVTESKVFTIPNQTNWTYCEFPLDSTTNDWSRMKELVFIVENWRNENRSGRFYLDDLSFTSDAPPCVPAQLKDDAMLDLVSQRAFGYFWLFTDNLGFALDRSTYSDIVSVGTIGFQLTAYCIGHQRGWADRSELEERVVKILRNLKNLPMGPEADLSRSGYRGFYYHFLAANTGTRKDPGVELSLYDTTLLMYGVLTCKAQFPNNKEIQALCQELFDRVEWDWFVDRAAGVNANQFFLAWKPGPNAGGTFFNHVDGQTDEAFMLDVLALGSQTHKIGIETYFARNRVFGTYPSGSAQRIMASWKGSLFNYFFASCWIDFHDRGMDLHPAAPCDIWENDKLAVIANRQFCIDHTSPGRSTNDDYATYSTNSWGLTACDNLVGPNSGLASEYFAFGALPAEENVKMGTKALHVGTLAVYGAASSINFTPEASIAALRHDFEIPSLWHPLFGFGDGFSLEPHYIGPVWDMNGNPQVFDADYLNGPWVNHTVMGIDVGPMLLAIENYRSKQIWHLTQTIPEIQTGLDRIFGRRSPGPTALQAAH